MRAPVVTSPSRVSVPVKKVCTSDILNLVCIACGTFSFLFSYLCDDSDALPCEQTIALNPSECMVEDKWLLFFFTCGVKEASLLLEDAYQICSQLTACFLWAKASHYASVGGCVSVVWDLVTTTSDLANGLHMNCICRTGRPLSLYTSQLSILLPIISGLADRSCVDNH